MSELLVDLHIAYPTNLPLGRGKQLLDAIDAAPYGTAAEYESLAALLKTLKAHASEIEDSRKFTKQPIIAAGKTHDEYFRPELNDCETAEISAKEKLMKYHAEQERLRREEQRKADEAAQRERDRLAKVAANNAEKARLLAEQGRAAEAARAQARADAAEEKSAYVVPPIIERSAPKVGGISSRKTWRAECTSLRELVEAIAAGKAPLSLVMPNDAVLGQQARSLQKEFVAPGVRVWMDTGIAAGAGASRR